MKDKSNEKRIELYKEKLSQKENDSIIEFK